MSNMFSLGYVLGPLVDVARVISDVSIRVLTDLTSSPKRDELQELAEVEKRWSEIQQTVDGSFQTQKAPPLQPDVQTSGMLSAEAGCGCCAASETPVAGQRSAAIPSPDKRRNGGWGPMA